MIIKYKVYSKILDRSFINEKEVSDIQSFETFARSLNLRYTIISKEKV